MPDQLESRLRAEGERLDIDQPPLAVIAARAAALRRRRLAARTGAAALAALVVAGVTLAARHDPRPAPTAVASGPADAPSGTWSAEGITISGLAHLPQDLPGSIREAEFADAERGYLLTADCCTTWISATADGGRTWRTVPSPLSGLPKLIATPDRITLLGPAPGLERATSTDGEHWSTDASPAAPAAPLTGESRLVALDGGECGAPTAGLTGTALAPVPRQPPLEVCWRSPVRAGDGSWWVGGRTADAGPAVAVSRDNGATWTVTAFPGFPGTARAAMLGRGVYVTIVAPQEAAAAPERLVAVAASADGGATFGPAHPTAGQATIGGDLVPLLDGRLLIVDGYGHWLVSEDEGISWVRLEGLHTTMRLSRTEAGYVAYRMTTIYTAFSVDGSTWQKLDAQ
ncbi:hypothetical protein [Dactylosporangium sp. CA-233914]|uniref:hypothetical protein n=1 Tax=Dactylosporangium sp. CA-233914 TaxID=3239934 RepID=UPI003D8B18AD